MKKLLHERLREYKNFRVLREILEEEDAYSVFTMVDKFADDIERYYIPRPRFEDGEPLQWGDEWVAPEYFGDDKIFTHKMFMALHKTQMEEYEQADENTPEITYDIDFFRPSDPNYRVKRPSPKVLDADGVEIKAGDTVWTINGKDFGTVAEVGTFHTLLLQKHNAHWFNNDQLTHKEPDSLESLRDDIKDYIDACSDEWHEMRVFANRLTAIMERDA